MKNKSLIFLVVGMAILFGVAALLLPEKDQSQKPRQMEINEFITQPGKYASPTGESYVHLWKEKDGKLKFIIHHDTQNGSETLKPSNFFEANSGWMMCWDSQDRLWTYIPSEYGPTCHYWEFTNDVTRSCNPGIYGGWEGIPEPFLTKLPEEMRKSCEKYFADKTQ